jgi:hypothetical protein
LISTFDGAWTCGNFTAALVMDENASEEQRAALAKIYGGDLGGDAANVAALIGDMKGVFTAPIEYSATAGEVVISVRERLEPEGRRTAVRDELTDLLRAHNESADGALAYPGEYLVAVGRRTERRG